MKNCSFTSSRPIRFSPITASNFSLRFAVPGWFGILWLLLWSATAAWGATYTVSNTNNSGAGSLRQAILDANANPGSDLINFSVAGTLTPASQLPTITGGLTIDGTTAPGYAVGTPTFVINAAGFTALAADGTSLLLVQGLDLSKTSAGQSGTGISVNNASGTVTIQNCNIQNRSLGIYCLGNANWTVQNNNLTNSGVDAGNPAILFYNIPTGTITASGNIFGGTSAGCGINFTNVANKIIGDETVPGANIVIEDATGLKNLNGTQTSLYLNGCSNFTIDHLNLGKSTGAQAGTGIHSINSSGNMIFRNCIITNRTTGVYCLSNANWTIQNNNFTNSGANTGSPAIYFATVPSGTIAASGNIFGGPSAGCGLRMDNVANKVIGDETIPGANITIEDATGFKNLNGTQTPLYLASCTSITVDHLNLNRSGAPSNTGIVADNSAGNMIIRNCNIPNRNLGIFCLGNANWTVQNNNLTNSGVDAGNPAILFYNIPTGTITASGNIFGGPSAGCGINFTNVANKIIGDETVPGANIVIEDATGLKNLNGTQTSLYLNGCSNFTIDHLNLGKSTGAQAGTGIHSINSSGNMSFRNCIITNRTTGVYCHSNANWTIQNNNFTNSGANTGSPAIYFATVPSGTIAASGNIFGGPSAGCGLRMDNVANKVIGDETIPGANITIEDATGFKNLNGTQTPLYLASCTSITVDHLNLNRSGAPSNTGIVADNSAGNMIIRNCNIPNRNLGIYCLGNANWTVQNNNLTNSGVDAGNPAILFYNIPTGTITASGNIFGGPSAGCGINFTNVANKIIGDETVPGANITIEDATGLKNLNGTQTSLYLNGCSNFTIDHLNLGKSTGAQAGTGIHSINSSGNMIFRNCIITNRTTGVYCHSNANWTIQNNNFTNSGANTGSPAIYFATVPSGTIAASGNIFGGPSAGCGLRMDNVANKVIGDETIPGANITIEDATGFKNLNGTQTPLYLASCTSITVDHLNLNRSGAPSNTGIVADNSAGNMIIRNCNIPNRNLGIYCLGNANWTVQNNNLTNSGVDAGNPAILFYNIPTGTITASGNIFGGPSAGCGINFTNVANKIIGDETVPGANIVIEDATGFKNLNGTQASLYLNGCSNFTIDHLNLGKSTGAQAGTGIHSINSSGNMIFRNCIITNRTTGVYCHSNANWTIQNNNFTNSGANTGSPAIYFATVPSGTIAASGNIFGGPSAGCGLRMDNVANKVIGDETIPGANITIEDATGFKNLNGTQTPLYLASCTSITVDHLNLNRSGAPSTTGIVADNSAGNMIIRNCNIPNRNLGIFCLGNANWTVQNNNLTNSGVDAGNPAILFYNIPTGTITASGNIFGGPSAGCGINFTNVANKIIGDETVPGANIVIEDATGFKNLNGTQASLYLNGCSNFTIDHLNLGKSGTKAGTGLYSINCNGLTVKNCTVLNRTYGMQLHGNSNTLNLSCNLFQSNTTGLYTNINSSQSIVNNNFVCNNLAVVQNGPSLTAQNNYWGSASAPTSGGSNGYTGTVNVSNHFTQPAGCAPEPSDFVWYADVDNDGYSSGTVQYACSQPSGYKTAINLIDTSGDCNDTNSAVHPGATELCNGIDDDCDGFIDQSVLITFYRDADGDSFGDALVTLDACATAPGYVSDNTDCDDTNANVHPGATELCNGMDDNCNGMTDEGVLSTWYADADGDGYGNAAVTTMACSLPAGYVANSTDCDDTNANVHPDATELCNDIDDNCNGLTDEGVLSTWYADADGDGYGNAAMTTMACSLPAGYVANNTDCDDTNANAHPGATEVCNGIDDNCNSQVDEGGGPTWYADADGDGYGNTTVTTIACSQPAGYVADNTDCDDSNANIHPGATRALQRPRRQLQRSYRRQ